MANITAKSPRLWGFFNCLLLGFNCYIVLLWRAYKHVSWLRGEALKSPDVRPEQFAIVVRDIPNATQGQTKKGTGWRLFISHLSRGIYRFMIVTDNKVVPPPPPPPPNKTRETLEGYKKKLARAEAVYEGSKTTAKPEGTSLQQDWLSLG